MFPPPRNFGLERFEFYKFENIGTIRTSTYKFIRTILVNYSKWIPRRIII